ncbi:MAG: phenylalanine--tRNA ligase subunit beta [Chloroflexota bacterium]
MKVSLKWLKSYVDINLSPAELARRLTMAGLEVKGTEIIGGSWDHVVIGQLKTINPHPNADRLRLATVDLGTGEETVVCGAPNLNVGDKIAFAHVGAQLIDGHNGQVAVLKPAKIRGVVSAGMVCSEKELGISDRHEGILVLPEDAPVGTPLSDYLGDAIFNLEVTPNRPDCLCTIGIAREIAALTGQNLHLPELTYPESASPVEQHISVEILAPDLCPRYCASLITGVKIAESPDWIQQRLLASGMRPINNIVDVTNYVMLEYGQPLHSFDYERLRGKKIIVRRAADGESIISLDGNDRNLTEEMLVIADAERAVAVAGVMGGLNSEVTSGTTEILLEAASFNPTSIHYTGRTLELPSEACVRFERGIRAELTMPALKRATQLIVELGGGEAAKGVVDVYPGKRETKPIHLSTGEVKRVLGTEFTLDQITYALTSLGFECEATGSGSEVSVTAPYWRSDIRLTVDLIEEVARILGYENIPITMLSQPIPRQNPSQLLTLKRKVRQCMVGYGFQELVTYSLTSNNMLRKLLPGDTSDKPAPISLMNPMSTEQEVLRPNLRANLLTALCNNRRREEGSYRLFELGRVYLPRANELPDEREVLCGVLSGTQLEKSWLSGDGPFDFFEAKGVVESFLSQWGVKTAFEASADASLHSNKQAAIIVDGKAIGTVGEVHPKVQDNFEIPEPVFLVEIDLALLLPATLGYRKFQSLPRFPAVVRDIALVVSNEVTHRQIADTIKGFPLVEQVALFDIYSGAPVPAGKKSMAYRITFQTPAHTLTDEEVNKVQQQILDKLASGLGATLRQ